MKEGKQYLALCCGSWHLVVCKDGRLGFDYGGGRFHAMNNIEQYHELDEVVGRLA